MPVYTDGSITCARAGRSVDDVSIVNRGMAAAGPVLGMGGCQCLGQLALLAKTELGASLASSVLC